MLEVHPERTVELTSLCRDDRERLRPLVAIGLVLAIGMILLLIGTNARAVQLNHQECQSFAVWSHDVQLMRDVGADKEKVRAYLESMKGEIPYFGMLLKALDGLWKDKGDRAETAQAVYNDCVRRRGQYGTDV